MLKLANGLDGDTKVTTFSAGLDII